MVYAPNKSLRKAFAILECLNLSRDGLTASEVAKRADIPSATTHRLLKQMVGLGYLQWDRRNQAYSVGFGLTLFGNKRLIVERIVQRARPILRSLSQRSRLTAYLGSLEGTQVIVEDRALYDQQAKLSHSVGAHLDGHAHSLGKALLALLPKREVVATYQAAPMQAHTRHTIRTVDLLLKDLRDVTVNGYAIDDEEMTLGVRSIAAALVNPRGRAICAIALEGPRHRTDPEDVAHLAPLLTSAAKAMMEDVVAPATLPERKPGHVM
jgi:DNA-binding IclR family transcriptional regulator